MRRMGGYRSDKERKAMFANMAKKAGNSKIPSSPSPSSFLGTPIPKFKGDDEERQFLESYPIDKLVIPKELKILSILENCKKMENSKGISDLSNISTHKNRKEILEILNDLEKQGYIELSNTGKDVEIRFLPWGYAQAVKNAKGQYAKILESRINLNKARKKVKKFRQDLIIKDTKELNVQKAFRNKLLSQKLKKSKNRQKAEDEELLNEVNEIIDFIEGKIATRKELDALIIRAMDEDLVKDVKYVLDNYFDIDPTTLKDNILTVTALDLPDEEPEIASLSYDLFGYDDYTDYVLRINKKAFEKGNEFNIEKDDLYLDALIHELTHWLRAVDVRREFLDASLVKEKLNLNFDFGVFISTDDNEEEKNTVLESVIREGKRVPKLILHYYTHLSPGGIRYNKKVLEKTPAAYDNIMLTMDRNMHSDISLPQVAENLIMRRNTAKINTLDLGKAKISHENSKKKKRKNKLAE